MDLSPFMNTRKLTRCVTVNATGEERPRFIEVENFRLWEYLVTHKHHLIIRGEEHCLWVPAAVFARNSAVYDHSGDVEPVNRIVISVFDAEMAFTTMIERFTHRSDSFKQLNVLNAHLSEQSISPESVESAVIPGYAIEPHLILGPQHPLSVR